jgi:diguanylate cyclase (GGDEF)-like protein
LAIERARRWDVPSQTANVRAALARAMATGYASQGRYAEAYAEVVRSDAFNDEAKRVATDVQVLRLQARYENAQRDAETARLRHHNEAAQLELAAQTARQRALWSVVALLSLAATATLAWAWRAWQQRRAMADLALRDELTGQPNRRAVSGYAQAQIDLAHKLGLPLTVAMIDLDHFKQVNDRHGHATGDEVLRALAASANQVLRGHDRLGRWGGEEWLLVAPGTSLGDMPDLFDRLRQCFEGMPIPGLDGTHGFSFSMGAAQLTPQVDTLDALVAQADLQLYRAKSEGRNRICC